MSLHHFYTSYSTTLGNVILRDWSGAIWKTVSSFRVQGNCFTFILQNKYTLGEKNVWLWSVTISRTQCLGVTIGAFLIPPSVQLVTTFWPSILLSQIISTLAPPLPSASARWFRLPSHLSQVILIYYFCLSWIFIAARGLCLVVASRGYSSLRCAGFSSRWLLLLRSTGCRRTGFSNCGSWL